VPVKWTHNTTWGFNNFSFWLSFPFFNPCVSLFPSGTEVPSHASVVYHILLEDLHNPKDDIIVEFKKAPETCTRKSVAGDYIRYHYNASFLNGITFDSRFISWLFFFSNLICFHVVGFAVDVDSDVLPLISQLSAQQDVQHVHWTGLHDRRHR